MLLIRADAGLEIGTGHVMRCLALAQAWMELGGSATFVMATEVPEIESRLKSEGFSVRSICAAPGSVEDADITVEMAIDMNACFVVVDGYHFSSEYQKKIKDSAKHLLFLDDYGHAEYYHADLVLNQNIYARDEIYKKRDPATDLLLGSPHVLLRREFWSWQGWRRTNLQVAHRVLVTLGGSDPENVTLKVIDSLRDLHGIELTVVSGGGNSHLESLEAAIKQSEVPIQLHKNATNMPELMARADLAIISGGTTSWEAAFMGLPCLIVIIAENQVQVAEKLGDTGAAVNLGWYHHLSGPSLKRSVLELMTSSGARASMSRIGQELVDGQGTNRVIKAMLRRTIQVREAEERDCKLLYDWANEAEARAASFSPGYITWETHRAWFEEKLQDPNCLILICADFRAKSIGSVRFDIVGDEAIISINLDVRSRGKGLASLIIVRTVDYLFDKRPVSRVNAFVRHNNHRSARAFERSGFSNMGSKNIKGYDAWHYVLRVQR